MQEILDTTTLTLDGDIQIDSHMKMHSGPFRFDDIELSDGTVIRKGQMMGHIDFEDNLPVHVEGTSRIAHMRAIRQMFLNSCNTLGELCAINDPRVEGLDYFGGVSVLSRSLEGIPGCEIVDMPVDEKVKKAFQLLAEGYANAQAPMRQSNEKSPLTPKIVIISRSNLISAYNATKGEQAVQIT